MSYKRILVNKKTGSMYYVKGSLKTGKFSVAYGSIFDAKKQKGITFTDKCENKYWRYGFNTELKITVNPDWELPKFYSTDTNPDIWKTIQANNLYSLSKDPLGLKIAGYTEFLDDYKYYIKNFR